ncbi:MAG: putative porin [Bacteroidota bacterium]
MPFANGQRPGGMGGILNRAQNIGSGASRSFGGGGGPFKDSLVHRTGMEDSASILFRYLDEEKYYFQDSSVHDFTKKWPVPWSHIFLGNTGSASRSLLFTPIMQAGWDHGFHAFDIYHHDAYQSKFYNVTKPFTELSYILGSKGEQNIGVFHTQNIRYNWNFSFDYKLTNAPGVFKNQKNSHNRYLLNSWYKSKNNRYYFFIAGSSSITGASENGGIADNQLLDDIPAYADRFTLPTNLGGSQYESRTLLSNVINTGNKYRRRHLLIRNSYDFGRRDSVKVDTAFQPVFISRFRLQHTFQYKDYKFLFEDNRVDADGYLKLYALNGLSGNFSLEDRWKINEHNFSLLYFPQLNNVHHSIKAGISHEKLEGDFVVNNITIENISISGDYRNRTRNGKWDFQVKGLLYVQGTYSGDYQAEYSLTRYVGKRKNLLNISLINVNRTPSFIHNDLSNFKFFNRGNTNFIKENTSLLSAKYQIPRVKMDIGLKYYVLSNYVYFTDIKRSAQEASLFNVAQFNVSRKFRLNRNWSWYADFVFQQATANAPVNLPLVVSRNRIAYEGTYFKNLNLSTGIELRYVSSFNADGYSPVLGQFYLQNDTAINNKPDITAFLHLRIRSWYLFLRTENLNAVQFAPQFGFLQNNFAAPSYPMPGLIFRLGIYWGFVN